MGSKKSIKKFMDKLGMKIYITPWSSDKSICVHLKVRKAEKLQYYVEDCYEMNDKGELVWKSGEFNVGVRDGVFAYLGDDNAVDNFFLDLTQDFAQKYMDEKIKPS